MSDHQSLIYKNPVLYYLVMRALYGKHFIPRYQAVADLIPPGTRVVDVCAGDCYLYQNFLWSKSVQYTGLDISPQFVAWAQSRGVNSRLFNAWTDDMPSGDILIMQGSLYQFLPRADAILQRMIAASQSMVIIAEPIQNLSTSKNSILATVGKYLTRPESHDYLGTRFDQETLSCLFKQYGSFERSFIIPGGREMIGVFRTEKL
jgi:hypothetical protein